MARSIGESPKAAKHFFSYFVEFMRFYTSFFWLLRKCAAVVQKAANNGPGIANSDAVIR
jgi:hypothetical protein